MAKDPSAFPRHGRESGHPRLSLQRQSGRNQDIAKSRGREVLTLADFTAQDIAALEAVRPPESSKAFDQEC